MSADIEQLDELRKQTETQRAENEWLSAVLNAKRSVMPATYVTAPSTPRSGVKWSTSARSTSTTSAPAWREASRR